MTSGQISTAQWKSVMFSGCLTTRPNLRVHITCRGDLAESMCVHVGWSAVMPGFNRIHFIISILAVYCDIGEKMYQVLYLYELLYVFVLFNV